MSNLNPKRKVKRKTQAITLLDTKNKDMFSPQEASSILGVSRDTVLRMCKSGKLKAIPTPLGRGYSWEIPRLVLEGQIKQNAQTDLVQRKTNDPKDLITAFRRACDQGLVTGKKFSKTTSDCYEGYLTRFTDEYGPIKRSSLRQFMLDVPIEQFGKREKVYKICVCFLKFLIQEGIARQDDLEDIADLKPIRHKPPKLTVVREEGLTEILKHCHSALDRVIVYGLSETGMRVTEFCQIKRSDLDLDNGTVALLRKGNKRQTIGLTPKARSAFEAYLDTVPALEPMDLLFRNNAGNPMNKDGIYARLKRIGKDAKVAVHPHALRRAYVTINVNKGRPIVLLSKSCGHNDLQTTMGYCRLTDEDVVKAMQTWE